jgi:hypothetical protein
LSPAIEKLSRRDIRDARDIQKLIPETTSILTNPQAS